MMNLSTKISSGKHKYYSITSTPTLGSWKYSKKCSFFLSSKLVTDGNNECPLFDLPTLNSSGDASRAHCSHFTKGMISFDIGIRSNLTVVQDVVFWYDYLSESIL